MFVTYGVGRPGVFAGMLSECAKDKEKEEVKNRAYAEYI
jgi:hypothetical protein